MRALARQEDVLPGAGAMEGAGAPVLAAEDLNVWYPVRRGTLQKRGWIRAVNGVSLQVAGGETLAVVGESGCGKTSLGRSLALLERPVAGTVTFLGRELTRLNRRQLRKARRQLQMIFQDPYVSLDPRQRVADIVAEPLAIRGVSREGRRRRVLELLDLVGLGPDAAAKLPREFSGGQRQRIGIARALAAEPRLVICDEPVSALDVSVQAQIVNLLLRLQRQLGLAYVFISHDLAVVRQIAARIAVMYLGAVVELAPAQALFRFPRHPYTVALLAAVPTMHRDSPAGRSILLPGDPPSSESPPSGCPFRTRCWLAERLGGPELCGTAPALVADAAGHATACHFADEIGRHEFAARTGE